MKKTTLAAALVLILLAGYVYWSDRADDTELSEDRVFDVAREDITRVEILSREEAAVVLERREDTLELVEPVRAAVDNDEVGLLLDNLENMTFARALDVEPGEDLSPYGLDEPALTLRFTTRDGLVDGVRFGKDTLTPSSQYAQRVADPRVLIVAEYLSTNLGKDAWDLRDKRVFDATPSEPRAAERLTVTRASDALVIERRPDGWTIVAPFEARADGVAVESMVKRLEELEMLDLIEGKEKRDDVGFGLERPAVRAAIAYDNDTDSSLQIEIGGARGIDYYARARSRSEVFVIDGSVTSDLTRDAAALVSLRLREADAASAVSVTVVSSQPSERRRTELAQGAAVVLAELDRARAEAATSGGVSERAVYRIIVSGATGEERIVLRAPGTAECAAIRGNEPVELRLDEGTCSTLVGALEAFLEEK